MIRAKAARVAAAAAILLASAAGAWWVTGAGGPDLDNGEQVATGRTLYAEHCASCHGASLEGQPDWRTRKADGRMPAPPHDASGHTWHHPDETLFAITRDGLAKHAPPGYQTDMPGFGGTLSDEQIRAVLAFIKSTWPSEVRARQETASAQARR
jgi:mono/diheme cytochrome c family protein